MARQRDAVPTLIDAIPDLPLSDAWRAEDFLLQLAGKTPPPDMPMGNAPQAAKKCARPRAAWWKDHGTGADLANLEETPRMLGRTLIVLLDQREVLELGADNRPRWEIKNVNFPLDAQLLGEDRVLIAEYNSNRVIERTLRGEIVWQRQRRRPARRPAPSPTATPSSPPRPICSNTTRTKTRSSTSSSPTRGIRPS